MNPIRRFRDSGIGDSGSGITVIAAGIAFARSSHPMDEMFTVNFNEHVWNGLPESMPFTTDTAQLQNALDQSTA
jgi:hypothetical protein